MIVFGTQDTNYSLYIVAFNLRFCKIQNFAVEWPWLCHEIILHYS